MAGECRGCIRAIFQLRQNFHFFLSHNISQSDTAIATSAASTSTVDDVNSSSAVTMININRTGLSEGESLEQLTEEIEDIMICDKIYKQYGVELGPLQTHKQQQKQPPDLLNFHDENVTNLFDEEEFINEYESLTKSFDNILLMKE